MNENEIKIQNLSVYDDLILSVFAKNSNFSGTIETYCSRKEFSKFANELQTFPNSLNHIVTLEIGEELITYDYFLVKAFVNDSVGHSNLFFIMSNKQIGRVEFTMNLEPASINEIGRKLILWIDRKNEEFVWDNSK